MAETFPHTEAMICPNCQTTNFETAHRCANCGTALSARWASPEAATVTDRGGDRLLGSTIAGRYRIEAKLGSGGMGAVYRATRTAIGDEVAVKILHAEQNDPKAAERFRREAQAAAKLKHPNAVTIHDFGITDDGLEYLVMEYVEGQSLRRLIREHGALDPATALTIITQVCAALDEAHGHQIIHRDIKPDNIVVRTTGTGLVVKVLDFGIAKLRDDVASHLTQTGSVLGTPHYMSPEQCLGEAIDGRADIYSLGIVLYEMLSGRVPFDASISTAIVIQHVNQAPPSLCAIKPNLPRQIEAVVFHALEKAPSARPAPAGLFAQEFSTAVSTYKAAPNADTHPPQFPYPPRGTGHETDETVVQPTPGWVSGGPNGSTRPLDIPGTRDRSDGLPWKIAAVAFGCVLFVMVVALITWSLTRNEKPKDDPTANRTEKNPTGPGSSPGNPAGNAPTPTANQPLNLSVTASSTRPPGSGTTYFPQNIIDGDLSTAWDENAPGPGIGSWVKCDFDREVALNSIQIYPGYFKGQHIWSINNRLAAATFYFSDGSSKPVSFPDLMEPVDVPTGGVRTRWVKLVIDRAYAGKDDLDTPISELKFAWQP